MQRLKRLAFYIEPVVFRQDPMFLRPWIEWIARLIQQNAHISGLSFGIASSPWLCRALQEMAGPIDAFPINPVDVLRPFSMDRVRYGQDLARPRHDRLVNQALCDIISEMVAHLEPDAILSFSQNRYLSALSPSISSLFSEMQPLPRTLGTGFFIDPSGHQAESLLVTAASRIRSLPISTSVTGALEKAFDNRILGPNRDHPETAEMLSWFRRETRGAPVAMLALQPPDWLTAEGVGDGLPSDSLLLAWLDALPEDWRAVATYHPGHKLTRALEESIAEQMPNFVLLPESWKQGRSEWLLQAVDAVVTVSSVVGWSALLAGKRTVTLGRSNLAGFAATRIADIEDVTPLSSGERYSLAAFLMFRYCVPETRFLDERGYFASRVSDIRERGEEFFFDEVELEHMYLGGGKL
jgi:hypothetical protein